MTLCAGNTGKWITITKSWFATGSGYYDGSWLAIDDSGNVHLEKKADGTINYNANFQGDWTHKKSVNFRACSGSADQNCGGWW